MNPGDPEISYEDLDDLARTTMQYARQRWPAVELPADVEEGLEALADHQWVYPWRAKPPSMAAQSMLQGEADRILQEILAPHGVTKEVT